MTPIKRVGDTTGCFFFCFHAYLSFYLKCGQQLYTIKFVVIMLEVIDSIHMRYLSSFFLWLVCNLDTERVIWMKKHI